MTTKGWEQVAAHELNPGDWICLGIPSDFSSRSAAISATVRVAETRRRPLENSCDILKRNGEYAFQEISLDSLLWRRIPGKPKVDLLTAPLSEVMVAVLEGADVREALNAIGEEQYLLARQVTVYRDAMVRNESKWQESVKRFDIINYADNAREIVAGKKDEE